MATRDDPPERREVSANRWRLVPYGLTGIVLALQIGTILVLNEGRLTYTLDDAYIHLAVSESLASGHYGIEPSVVSAPSSSILWPFLLAFGAPFGWHVAWPLVLNLAAVGAALALLAKILRTSGVERSANGAPFAAGLLTLLALGLNLTGLALTGMEHSLQVALALTVIVGMIAVARGAPPPTWLWLAIVAGPLVRYENAALTVAALLWLALRGHRRMAGLAGLACGALLGLFSGFLMQHGLEPLPGPVMESFGTGGGDRLRSLLIVLPARILAILTGALVATALLLRRDRTLLLCGALVPVLHLAFGSSRGFARYEIYALASVVALLIYGLRRPLGELVATRGAVVSLLVVGAVLTPVLASYPAIAYRSPRAAHNIFQQHEQMHRFVTAYYRQPVAVNDLGRVTFDNPNEVLDLWGLSSAEVRRARANRDPQWPGVFVEQRGIELAMLYESWFTDRIPPTWRRIAVLRLHGKRVTPSSSEVSFYLTRPGPAEVVMAAMRRFRDDLPSDVTLEIEPSIE
ncbi:MAG: hypothetical protein AAF657_05400 [Acidobacteriota bacterium]